MESNDNLLKLINEIEIKAFLNGEEKAYLISNTWISTGIKEEFPLTYNLLKKLNRLDHYIYPKVNAFNELESKLIIAGYKNTSEKEIPTELINNLIIQDLGPIEDSLKAALYSIDDLQLESVIEDSERFYFKYKNTSIEHALDTINTYRAFVDDDYDMDKNAIIISKS